jgi:hypothetical protein
MLALVTVLLAGACGPFGNQAAASPTPKASHSPSPSASASPSAATSPTASSPVPVTGSFAVLSTAVTGDTYSVTLIGVDGRVAGTAQASSPLQVSCGSTAAALVPQPISTSNSRVYFMDAQGVVRFLGPQGDTGRATTVPVAASRRSMFSVSPDDQRIAVVVSDFTATGVSLRIYVEDLNGGTNHADIFTSTGSFGLWPIGWHGTSLVLAKVAACTQGGGLFCCSMLELHVVDPGTAIRRFTVGGPQCVIVGTPSPAGAVCEDKNFVQASVVDWTATVKSSFPVSGPTPAYLSPDGSLVATVGSTKTTFVGSAPNQALAMQACGWIDSLHVISGGDAQQQPRIGAVNTGALTPVAAQGNCAGRLPGGL